MRKSILITGIAALVGFAIVIWATAGDEGEPRPSRDANQARAAKRAWDDLTRKGKKEAQRGELDHWPFAGIEAGPAMPDGLRREASQVLGNPEQLALRFGDARFGRAPNGVGIWVVQGEGVMCMFRAVRVVGACRTSAQAYRNGMALQTYKHQDGRPTKFEVLGIAPDRLSHVPAKIGRRWIKLDVVGNTFFAKAAQSIGIPPSLVRP